jgi:hypothetical protein
LVDKRSDIDDSDDPVSLHLFQVSQIQEVAIPMLLWFSSSGWLNDISQWCTLLSKKKWGPDHLSGTANISRAEKLPKLEIDIDLRPLQRLRMFGVMPAAAHNPS